MSLLQYLLDCNKGQNSTVEGSEGKSFISCGAGALNTPYLHYIQMVDGMKLCKPSHLKEQQTYYMAFSANLSHGVYPFMTKFSCFYFPTYVRKTGSAVAVSYDNDK